MVRNELLQQILQLNRSDQEYVRDVLDATLMDDHLTPQEQQELLQRIEFYEKNPQQLISWDQVKGELRRPACQASVMTYRLGMSAEVTSQILSASSYYENIQPQLGVAFENEIDAMLQSIVSNPYLYPKSYGPIHRAVIRRFKKQLYYTVREDLITVLELRDARQEPPDWASRGFTNN